MRRTDALGDEGAIFRRMVLGDQPTESELAELRGDEHQGTFKFGTKTLAVEYAFIPSPCAILKCGGGGGGGVVDVPKVIIPAVGESILELSWPKLGKASDYIDRAANNVSHATDLKTWLPDGIGEIGNRMVNVLLPNYPAARIQDFYDRKARIQGAVHLLAAGGRRQRPGRSTRVPASKVEAAAALPRGRQHRADEQPRRT